MAEINLGNDSTLDVSVATDKKIETSVSDVNYIPGYKVAEEERKSNELVRQENEEDRIALYEDMQNKLESGYFNGKDGAIQYTAGTGIEITENNVINNTQTSAEWGNITGTLSDQNDLQNALNDKADSSDIPLNVSELVNDSNFIDNTVNNLTNYYLKTETYTKTEIDTLIAQIPGFNVVVVQTLPVSDIDTHTIYLVPKTGSTGDIYDEYLYINNTWELIGNTAVDLSNYYTKPETNTLLNTKQDTLVSGTSIKTINNESLLGSGNVNTNEIFVGDVLPEDADSIKLWLTDDDALDGEGNYISNEYGTSQEIGYSQEYVNNHPSTIYKYKTGSISVNSGFNTSQVGTLDTIDGYTLVGMQPKVNGYADQNVGSYSIYANGIYYSCYSTGNYTFSLAYYEVFVRNDCIQ